jgi:hypothetical protein
VPADASVAISALGETTTRSPSDRAEPGSRRTVTGRAELLLDEMLSGRIAAQFHHTVTMPLRSWPSFVNSG